MEDWMNHPKLENLEPIKVELIRRACQQTSGKSGKDLAPIMMALITGANRQGIHFTPDEIALILDLLKEGKSEEERSQIDRTIQMVQAMLNNSRK